MLLLLTSLHYSSNSTTHTMQNERRQSRQAQAEGACLPCVASDPQIFGATLTQYAFCLECVGRDQQAGSSHVSKRAAVIMTAARLLKDRKVHMTDSEGLVVKPIEQVTVMLFGSPVRAVRLPDGRIAAVFTDLTDALNLDRASQSRRVRADDVTADQLFLAEIDVEDTPQPMDVLTAWAIPIWLTGIHPGKLALDKRPKIVGFKREAADVLYRYFSQPHESPDTQLPALSAPTRSIVPAPVPQPDKPTPDAGRAAWIEYHQAMAAWLEWQDDMDRWRADSDAQAMRLNERQATLEARQDSLEDRMETRMEGVEELSRLFVDVTRALPPLTLTPEHQATVKAMVGRLHDVGGFAYATIYGELNTAFHVGKYTDIPEASWEQALDWLQTRIDAAEKRQR